MSTATRTAIITGAGRGIGAATARRLSSDGFAVAIVDLDLESAQAIALSITTAGGTAIAVEADVSQETSVAHAVQSTVDALGPPQVLINNAGIIRDNLLFKMSVDEWDSVMSVHLRGSFLMSKMVQQHMVAGRWGRIVNLSSTSALGNRGQANYAAAKAGLQGFTKTLAIELGPFGITVNAIAPGFIETEMAAATAARMGVPFAEFLAQGAAAIPVRRVGQPEDIAATVAFLVREESSFVSGQVIYVAGGPRT